MDKVSPPSIGDKVVLSDHRVMHLQNNQVALISEISSGWCVLSRNDYNIIKSCLAKEFILQSDLGKLIKATLEKLWKADLLRSNGKILSQHYPTIDTPILLSLKLTGSCNFRCRYCYDFDNERFKSDMDTNLALKTISYLLEKTDDLTILFHGGEPLLRFEEIKKLVHYAIKQAKNPKGLRFSIQTNGSLFTEEIIKFLEEYNFTVGLSLNGHTDKLNEDRITGLPMSCLEIHKELMEKHPDFVHNQCGFIAVVSKSNIKDMPAYALWLQKHGVKGLLLNFLHKGGRGEALKEEVVTPEEAVDLFRQLINLIKKDEIRELSLENINKYLDSMYMLKPRNLCYKSPCGAAGEFLVLDAENNFRACDCVYDDYLLLKAKQPSEVINDPTRVKIKNRIKYMQTHNCSHCPLFGFCGGTCVALSLLNTGSDHNPDPIKCSLHKYMYEKLLNEFVDTNENSLFDYFKTHRYRRIKD